MDRLSLGNRAMLKAIARWGSIPPPSRRENGRAAVIFQTADEWRDGAPHAGQQDFEIACG
jgi:hypothetical protein